MSIAVIFAGVLSSTANAQNSSTINSNGLPTNGTAKTATANGTAKTATANGTAKTATANGTAKTATANGTAKTAKQTNKTVVVAAPGTATTVVTAGNKTIISTTPTSTTSNGSSLANLNRTGFANLYVLTSPTGKTFPLKYTMKGGKLVGILADKDRTTLVLVLDPGQNGGNMTLELPRNIIDSKGASNSDTKYQIKIDGKGVDYKEVANNMNARILSIGFSKDNRFIEIIGTQMTP
jgi:hypothetical protein